MGEIRKLLSPDAAKIRKLFVGSPGIVMESGDGMFYGAPIDVMIAQLKHASAKLAESWNEKQFDLKQAYYNCFSAATFEERVEYVAETQRI